MKTWNNGKLLFQAYFFCLKTEDFPRHRVPWCIRAGQGMMGSQTGKSLFEKIITSSGKLDTAESR